MTVLISVLGVLGAVVLAAGLALLVAGRMGDVAARQGTEAAAPRASSEEVQALAAGLEGAHDGVAVDWDGAVGSGPDLAAGARVDDAPGVLLVETTLGTMMGTGTGIVLSEDGLAITNYHVVEDSSDVFVTVADTGRRYTATVLGRDAQHDIAVLDVEGVADLTPTSVSRAVPARGEQVAAVGNGSGQGHLTAVVGEVLRTDQSIMAATEGTDDFARLTGLIQTDADVVPGYSGGPLVDAEGQVVGVTVAASEGTTAEAVDGFANCAEFGFNAVCPVVPECWGGLLGLTDVPVVATPIECTDSHPYQTFIAVQLPDPPRTQSELENAPAIKALCTKAVLNRRLASGQAGATWDIQPIPYKVFPSPDNLSRCLVSTGVERTSPLPMKAP